MESLAKGRMWNEYQATVGQLREKVRDVSLRARDAKKDAVRFTKSDGTLDGGIFVPNMMSAPGTWYRVSIDWTKYNCQPINALRIANFEAVRALEDLKGRIKNSFWLEEEYENHLIGLTDAQIEEFQDDSHTALEEICSSYVTGEYEVRIHGGRTVTERISGPLLNLGGIW